MTALGSIRCLFAIAGVLAGAALLAPGASYAQDADPVAGATVWKTVANCRECHGWAANGQQELPQQPQGANLRETTLDKDAMAEIIRCGKPASEMPYFGGNSTWTATGKCFGMTRAEVGAMMPIKADTTLSDRQVVNVVAYIFANLAGKGPVTAAECDAFFGAGNPKCAGYAK